MDGAPRKKKKNMGKKKTKTRREEENMKEQQRETEEQVEKEEDEELCSEDEQEQGEEQEQEDEEQEERRRRRLLEAISGLSGRRKRQEERSEAALQLSEFGLCAEGQGPRLGLQDLLGTGTGTGTGEQGPALSSRARKQLKNLQTQAQTLQSPLSRQDTERIQRDVAFSKTADKVSRWSGVIHQNQRKEQLVFPLNQEPSGPRPMERVVTGWKARTPLEQEVFALLTANKQPVLDPVLTPAEEAAVRAMSLEDAKIRRAELQKARALQSYYEAKARRESKIKSKKYHKVQNKAKRREQLRSFEEQLRSDPEAALQELQEVQLKRMEERMSLKHQNSGRWARSKAIMAKYDEGARRAMQQQLEVNKELTQKLVTSLNQEEEEEEQEQEEEPDKLPDFVNEAEQGADPSNPWMRGKLTEEPAEEELKEVKESRAMEKTAEEEEEEEEEEAEEEVLLREFDNRRKMRKKQEEDAAPGKPAAEEEEEEEEEEAGADEEEEELSEFRRLLRREAVAPPPQSVPDSSAPLQEELLRVQTLEEVELLAQEAPPPDAQAEEEEAPAEEKAPPGDVPQSQGGRKKKKRRGIELKQVLTKESVEVRGPLAPTMQEQEQEEQEEEQDQRSLIREAFAGDDVVSDFLRDKRKQEAAGRPQVVDLSLPGWGEWGGSGLRPSRLKRRRFRLKVAAEPEAPRRDRDLPAVIIREGRAAGGAGGAAALQPPSLPFPFQNTLQFESTLRCPLGRTWNTERTVLKTTRPRLLTRPGAIIQPMEKEELLKEQKEQKEQGERPAGGGAGKRRCKTQGRGGAKQQRH